MDHDQYERDRRYRVDVHVHGLQNGMQQGRPAWVDEIVGLLKQLGVTMTAQFDVMKAEVERNTTVSQSVVTLVQSLADQIEALKDDPVALQALADQLRSSDDAVAASVLAHTPPVVVPPTAPRSGTSSVGR